MTNELVVTNGNTNIITFDDEKVALIKRTIAKGATDDELALFMHQCQKVGLDPLARQIYFQKYNSQAGPQMTIITGIDGYRLIADRSGKYAGSDEPVYDGRIKERYPAKATVTVYKIVGGMRVGFASSAYWDEYYPGDGKRGTMWRKMPHVMLAKVAEAAALRKAFPADLSGMYTHEEMDQAQRDIINVTPVFVEPDPPTFDDLPSASDDPRGETSPQSQAQRERPTAASEPPANGNGKLKAFHALGRETYGPDWDEKRRQLVEALGKTSSKDLTDDEIGRLMAGMSKKLNGGTP